MVNFTIAICTWNRARLLDQTLGSLAAVEVPPGVVWELIVVDNNSTDRTAEVVAGHRSKLPIRSLRESRQGKSHALNRAVESARGEWILWTDDDVLFDPPWMRAYADAVAAEPGASFFSGRVAPFFEVPPPEWVQQGWRQLGCVYGLREFGDEPFPIRDIGDAPFGLNWAVRREVQREYRYNPDLGPSGTGRLICEETEVIASMMEDGQAGVWIPGARIRHVIPPERMTRKYIRSYFFGLGQSRRRMRGAPKKGRVTNLYQALALEIKYRLHRSRRPAEVWVEEMTQASRLWGLLTG